MYCRAVENREAEVESVEAVSGCHLEKLAHADTYAAGLGRFVVGTVGTVVDVSFVADRNKEIEVGSGIPYPEIAAAGPRGLCIDIVVRGKAFVQIQTGWTWGPKSKSKSKSPENPKGSVGAKGIDLLSPSSQYELNQQTQNILRMKMLC